MITIMHNHYKYNVLEINIVFTTFQEYSISQATFKEEFTNVLIKILILIVCNFDRSYKCLILMFIPIILSFI